jgi:uncharacterized protein with NRDE domain
MCSIFFSYLQHPRYRLILVANRDEFYHRKTQIAHFWGEKPVLAGKDLVGGGTWLGVGRQGRWSALTNYRVPMAQVNPTAKTRGNLTLDFLTSEQGAQTYLQPIQAHDDSYNGYNLLLGSPTELAYYSNVEKKLKILEAGLYGVSNHLLNTPWFKVEKGIQNLQTITAQEDFNPHDLIASMQSTEKAPEDRLPDTGVPRDWEYALSALFVEMPARDYGTCCTSVLLMDYQNRVHFIEKNYTPAYKGVLQEFHFEY